MKQKETAHVLFQREIAPGIFDMWIETSLAAEAKPGQFLGVYPRDKSTLLPRPISICQVRRDTEGDSAAEAEGNAVYPGGANALRIVYRVAGAGTREFSAYRAGETVELLGPLGNGFPMFPLGTTEKGVGKKVFLMGGGIGIPPILELAKRLDAKKVDKQIILGYRDRELFLKDDFARHGTVYIATEDGSAGTKGNVMDAVRENALEADVIFACGPMPMLRAVKKYAAERQIPAYISLEEHMACGVGACLGCVVKTKDIDRHSHVNNARICTDGPVFEAGEVEI